MQNCTPLAQLPFSQACENNKHAILTHLQQWLTHTTQVLEVGSGTGQHCVFFAENLPHLRWQPSDQAHYLDHLQARLQHYPLNNLADGIELDVNQSWPQLADAIDAIYTANTLHIMSPALVEVFFVGCGKVLANKGCVVIYGPFNYLGEFTSDSNAQFDVWLKQQHPLSGIRDIEWIISLAKQQGLILTEDVAMPANNRMLYFTRT
ncbi:DUF938 domain-containing protein [Shewanella ulleungensis]|jgi:cyclopropane fatty-acyl-phospholipid synthase-like methyltransferase|uniref:Methylase n=1 Tax=Shewanella ulleungensis TaxID=2282699 RepID=A0ABQ2QCC7_9GAMM|nr:DUF938 domain-containing protein [Shewanella ulleungensis]MCL1149107.1 class I SAM-dependent methyltransferase [Shewanella ulleungensis]GGP73544.1 methylase [Shewanella ulleungensis]